MREGENYEWAGGGQGIMPSERPWGWVEQSVCVDSIDIGLKQRRIHHFMIERLTS